MFDNKTSFRFHRRWLAASFLTLAMLLVLTHIPHAAIPEFLNATLLDKVEHVLAYGAVAIFFTLSVPNRAPFPVLLVGLLTLAAIGVVDEVTQPLFGRSADVRDYVADLVGISLGFLIFLVKRRLRIDTAAS